MAVPEGEDPTCCHRLDKDDLEGGEKKKAVVSGAVTLSSSAGASGAGGGRMRHGCRVTRCTMVDTGRGFYEEELLRLLNANKDGHIVIILVLRRDGPERSGGVTTKEKENSTPPSN